MPNNNNDPRPAPAFTTNDASIANVEAANMWSYQMLERPFRAPAPQPVFREVEAVEVIDESAPIRERFTASGRIAREWSDFADSAWAVPARPARAAARPAPTPVPVDDLWPIVLEKAMVPLRSYYGSETKILCRIPNMPVWGATNVVYQITLNNEPEPYFACYKVTYRGNRVYEVTLSLDPMPETAYMYHVRRNCGPDGVRKYHEAVRAARYKLIAKQYALNAKVYQQFLPTILDDVELRYAVAPREYVKANKQVVRQERAAIAEQDKIRKHLSSPDAIRPASMPETDRGDRARSSRSRTRNRSNDDEN